MKYSTKELLFYFTKRLPMIVKGRLITRNLIRVHWGKDLNNFGDCLQPYILRHYGLLPVYVPSYTRADIILQGSILQDVPGDFSGYILGTGGDSQPYYFPKAKIVAVRGRLTLRNVKHNDDNILLGDTGLLTALVFPEPVTKGYEIGIVPHFVDLDSVWLRQWKERFGPSALFISPLQDAESVVRQIKSCKIIVASSLHGLIVADSFHIPTLRIISRVTMPLEFHDYKYADYYSALNMKDFPMLEVSGTETMNQLLRLASVKPTTTIDKIIRNLDSAMWQFSKQFKR